MKDKTIAVCSFDLQKQLSCPKSEDSAYYYKSELNVFNFTVFNMVERLGVSYLWHEGVGKKGSSEISSALLHYIEHLVKQAYKDIRFWSDNCAGQNKNRFLYAMYEYVAVKYDIKITHRYLEPGHTQMEADSKHARIEKATDKKDIYDFDGWVEAIEEAKESLPKYRVQLLNKENIFSFKTLVAMQNLEVDLQRQHITWKKVKEITINGQEGNLVRVKYDLSSESFVTMGPNKTGRPVNLKSFKPSLAYDSNIPLSKNTIKDLTCLCDNCHIPINKQAFIRNVLSSVNPVEEEELLDPEFESDEEEEEDPDEKDDGNPDENMSGKEDDNLGEQLSE